MKIVLHILLFGFALVLFSQKRSQVTVLYVDCVDVVIDGSFAEDCWGAAAVVEAGSIKVLFTQSADSLYLGIKRDAGVARYVDLFFSTDGSEIVNLHASMAVGERQIVGSWTDENPPWRWGNNRGWSANTVSIAVDREDLPFLDTVVPYDGFEFRIAKSKIMKGSKLYIEVKDFVGEASGIQIPEGAEPGNADTWLLLLLD